MSPSPRGRARALALGVSVAMALSAPLTAYAADTAEQCVSAYADGQRARKSGAFAQAQQLFALCGGSSCPSALHGDCQLWLSEVEAATPTSIFRVSGQDGQELHGVQISIDGQPQRALGGQALAFDPGEHELVFELEGYQPLTQRFTFAEGDKLVPRDVTLTPLSRGTPTSPTTSPLGTPTSPTTHLDETRPTDDSRPSTLPLWLGAGIGAAGLAGFGYFGLAARSNERALDECSPGCSVSRVDEVKQQYLVANVSLAVGAAGLVGAAAWLLFASAPEPSAAARAADGVAEEQRLQVYIGATSVHLVRSF
jgi:hypothetical protein